NDWEEINRDSDPTTNVSNFGWPCYEGVNPQPGYQAAGLNICTGLYAGGSGGGTFGDNNVYTSIDTAGQNLKEVSSYTATAGNVDSGGYADGPSNPFGTATTSNKRYSLYATLQGAGGSLVTPPLFTYNHGASVVSGDGCPTGGSSVAGVTFYNGGTYPSTYNGG